MPFLSKHQENAAWKVIFDALMGDMPARTRADQRGPHVMQLLDSIVAPEADNVFKALKGAGHP